MAILYQTQITSTGDNYKVTVTTQYGIYEALCSEFEYGSFIGIFMDGLNINKDLASNIFKPGNTYFDGGCGEFAGGFGAIANKKYGYYYGCDISTIIDRYPGDYPNRTLASKMDILSGLLTQEDDSIDVMMFFGIDETIIKSGRGYIQEIIKTIPKKLKVGGYILSQNSTILIEGFINQDGYTTTDQYGEQAIDINDISGYVIQKN